MILHPVILYLLFGVALFGGGGAILQNMTPPAHEEAIVEKKAPAAPKATRRAERDATGDKPAAAPAVPQPVRPSFDVVRIERQGDGVIAGRAESGWTVIVESDGDKIARAEADRDGEWAVVLDKPLPPGEHSLGLRAFAPDATRGLVSEQQVAVSVTRPEEKKPTIVALSEPGRPTKVLTPPEKSRAFKEPEKAPEEPPAKKPEPAPQDKTEKAAAPPEPPAAPAAEKEVPAEPAPEAASSARETVVSFDALDYEVNQDGAGTLFLSGQAEAGMRVILYLDNGRIGDAVAAADGAWTFKSARTLPPEKRITLRADAVQADGQVASRAEVPFTAPAAKPQTVPRPSVVASAEPEPAVPAEAAGPEQTAALPEPEARAPEARAPQPEQAKAPPAQTAPPEKTGPRAATNGESKVPESQPSEPATATAEPEPEPEPEPSREPAQPPASQSVPEQAPKVVTGAVPEPVPEPEKQALLAQKRSIVVRRGDTLWHIAERRYGKGWRYTVIYRDNKDQIRDPHWIYPGQEFTLPSQ